MSSPTVSKSNGVIRIGRKGIVKFAFGEDGQPFKVDVVTAFREWYVIDEQFRIEEGLAHEGEIPSERMQDYYRAAVDFAACLSNNEANPLSDALAAEHDIESPIKITTAEALHFIACLREQYDELAVFFRPRSRDERASHVTSEVELRFSPETEEGQN